MCANLLPISQHPKFKLFAVHRAVREPGCAPHTEKCVICSPFLHIVFHLTVGNGVLAQRTAQLSQSGSQKTQHYGFVGYPQEQHKIIQIYLLGGSMTVYNYKYIHTYKYIYHYIYIYIYISLSIFMG